MPDKRGTYSRNCPATAPKSSGRSSPVGRSRSPAPPTAPQPMDRPPGADQLRPRSDHAPPHPTRPGQGARRLRPPTRTPRTDRHEGPGRRGPHRHRCQEPSEHEWSSGSPRLTDRAQPSPLSCSIARWESTRAPTTSTSRRPRSRVSSHAASGSALHRRGRAASNATPLEPSPRPTITRRAVHLT